jgi:hypothetical protein
VDTPPLICEDSTVSRNERVVKRFPVHPKRTRGGVYEIARLVNMKPLAKGGDGSLTRPPSPEPTNCRSEGRRLHQRICRIRP